VPFDVETVRTEHNPQLAAIVQSSDTVMVRRYAVRLETAGDIVLVVPAAAVDALRERLQPPRSAQAGPPWRGELESALRESELELETVFARLDITLRALVQLRPGDVLELERPDAVLVLADGQPLFTARYGTSSGRGAVQLVGRVPRGGAVTFSRTRRNS